MKIVKLDVLFPFPDELDGDKILRKLELVARNCYQSEGKIDEDWRCLNWENDCNCDEGIIKGEDYVCGDRERACDYRHIFNYSAPKLLKNIIKRKHFGILEHHLITVKAICDRVASHEWVRHRIGSYAQESQRYVDYRKKGLSFIAPIGTEDNICNEELFQSYEDNYLSLLDSGWTKDQVKSHLPEATKTYLFVTYNLRQWRTFFEMRGNKKAHPHIRFIANKILTEFKDNIPVIFDDLEVIE
jgi:thymidylate synthase (FAD)